MLARSVLTVLLVAGTHVAFAQPSASRQHEVTVTPGASWTIATPTVPRNESVRIENVGSTEIEGARLILNDRDRTTVDGLLAEIVRDGMTDDQKARAIYQFVKDRSYHWYPVADFALDGANPLRFFNFYGYGFCSDTSGVLAVLFQRVGFPVRWWNPGNPPNHVVVESYYDGRWHLFDADRDGLYLLRDNTTVAGVTDLIADPWLVTRAGALHADLAELYRGTSPGAWWAADPLDADDVAPLALKLRPREAVTLRWDHEDLSLHSLAGTPQPPVFANGDVDTLLLPDDLQRLGGTERQSNVRIETGGAVPAWGPDDPTLPADVTYRLTSAYPIVGGELDARVVLGSGGGVNVYMSRFTDDIRLVGQELGKGGFRVPFVTVADTNIATFADDGTFPLVHTVRAHEMATMVFHLVPRADVPLRVGGTFYRASDADVVAMSVSSDGVAWTTQWQADADAVGYFTHLEDITTVAAGQPLFVRLELTARSFDANWTAGLSELRLEGLEIPVETRVWSSDELAPGTVDVHVPLGETLLVEGGQARYGYLLRVVVTGPATAVEQVRVRTVFQANPAFLPGLEPGDSRFTYVDASGSQSSIRVTHRWHDTGVRPLGAPLAPVSPEDGGTVVIDAPIALSWQPAPDPDAVGVFQHPVQVCADDSCTAALGAPLDIYTSGDWFGADGIPGTDDDVLTATPDASVTVTAAEWFTDGRTYFWRVRALGRDGVWSPFSAVWRFEARGNPDLPSPDLAFTSETPHATAPLVSLSGTAASAAGLLSLAWWTDRGASGMGNAAATWTLDAIPVEQGTTTIFVQVTDLNGRQQTIQTTVEVESYTYYLAEGVTGALFDTFLLLTNPANVAASVVIEYYPEGRTTLARRFVLEPMSRRELRLDDLWGEDEVVPLSIRVISLNAVPLIVERAMFWGTPAYGGHAGRAVAEPRTQWLFAEGSQGFFQTYVLLQNPGDMPANVTVSFSDDRGVLERQQYRLDARSRFTVATSQLPSLAAVSFSIDVVADQPIVAERSMYFGTNPFWQGGHGTVGVTTPRQTWLHAEGATGNYFDTYILLANPNDQPATVDVEYLTGTGDRIIRRHVVAGHARETINVEDEDVRLADAAVSTVVRSDLPIVTERAMYWPGTAETWQDAHIGTGTAAPGLRWGLAGGRVGTDLAFETYLLITNQDPTRRALVKGTFIRDDGTILERTWPVEAGSRFNVHVNSMVPELVDESFSVVLDAVNGVPVAAERAMYWSASGVFWIGGTSIAATPLP